MQFIQIGENDILKRRVYLHLVDATDGITPETGEAGGRTKVSINGAAPSNSVNTIQAIDTTDQPGTYYLELSPIELKDPGFVSVRYKSANTAEFVDIVQVIAFDPYTRRYGDMWNGGADVDYKRIKKLIDEAVGSLPKPEQREPDLVPIYEGLQAVIQEIRDIRFPEQKETDLSPLLVKVQTIQNALSSLEFPKCDHKELMKRLDDLGFSMDANTEQLERHVTESMEPVKGVLSDDVEKMKEETRNLGKKFDDIQYVVLDKQKKEAPKNSVLDEYLKL